jgi:hypothetical protein
VLGRGDSKCQARKFKSLLFDSPTKTPENSDSGIRYGIASAGSGQAEAARNGQEVVQNEVNLDFNVQSIVDSTVAQRASARGRKIKMASIGPEYSRHIQLSLLTQDVD